MNEHVYTKALQEFTALPEKKENLLKLISSF
jgi:hypothetical protein